MKIGIDARFLTHPQFGGFKTYTTNLVESLVQLDTADEYVLYLDRTAPRGAAGSNAGMNRRKVLEFGARLPALVLAGCAGADRADSAMAASPSSPAGFRAGRRFLRTRLGEIAYVARGTGADDDARIQALIDERVAAKKARDFARADAIRDRLAGEGIVLEDTPQGVRWKRA